MVFSLGFFATGFQRHCLQHYCFIVVSRQTCLPVECQTGFITYPSQRAGILLTNVGDY